MPRMDMPDGANVLVPGEYSLIEAALSNKGNPTSRAFGNLMLVEQSQPVRIVDKNGQVIFEGIGPEAARQAVAIGQDLTDTQGKKAGWDIQTVPVGTDNYKTIANEKADANVLGQIADIALPVAASFIPGIGPVLGAALGSAASSVAQGRSLENTLLRAGLAAGGSALGGQVFGQAASGGSAPMSGINADLIPNALQGLNFGSLASASIPAGVGGAVGDIIVNAAPSLLGSTVGSTVGSAVASAVPSLISAPPSVPVEQPAPTQPEEIVVTGAETPVIPAEVLAAAPVAGGLLATTGGGASNVVDGIDQATGDIVVEAAPKPVLPPAPIVGVETALPAITGGALTPAQTAGTAPPAEKGGVLGTGLTLPQLLSIGGIGADLLKNLLAGGGDTGPTTPYVSPFGTGTGLGLGTGQDMRANPNIADYERYGFGPEAMFFQPGYGLLNSAVPAPAAPQAQSIMATNPRYEPLI